tara:strand:- start:455 stop:1237 length:783 start_codon:yes stop_codon:yes gene_type:complete
MTFYLYDLIELFLPSNSQKINGKIINIDNTNYYIALGRLGRFNFNFKNERGVKFCCDQSFPSHDINLLKNDIILRLKKRELNKNYKLFKRENDINLNDIILLKLISNKSDINNDDFNIISKIPNIKKGVICKIVNIKLFSPPVNVLFNKKTINIIPGSFTLHCGDYINSNNNKEIDTLSSEFLIDIFNINKNEILKGNCVFNINFRDIDLIYNITKLDDISICNLKLRYKESLKLKQKKPKKRSKSPVRKPVRLKDKRSN